MFTERFEGSTTHGARRTQLSFTSRVRQLGPIKDEWDFITNDTLRSNIAAELQKVHFDVLLVNNYNVYYSPEAMTMKHAIIACASVAEAVLEVAVKMIEDDPRVRPIIESRERVFDELYTLQLKEFEVPDGSRVIAGVQREVVRTRLDRNTKMELLIRAAHTGEIYGDAMERKLQQLRRLRNRVHIKTVEELEYAWYTPQLGNGAIDILEEFRLVAKAWIQAREQSMFDTLRGQARTASVSGAVLEPGGPITPSHQTFAVDDLIEHASLGGGLVVAAEGDVYTVRFEDGSLRRLMTPYAPMRKVGVIAPGDEIPF